MKHLTLKQIVDTVNRAYNITDARQYNAELTNAISECKRAEVNLAIIHDHISNEKCALTSVNMALANEYEKLDKAQTEHEINEITSNIRWYAIDRARIKHSLKYYRNTARSIINNSYAAYKQLLKHYQDALDIIEQKEAKKHKESEEAKAADLYTLTRKEAFDLLSHITNAVTSNKDEQQFLLDMSHYKK